MNNSAERRASYIRWTAMAAVTALAVTGFGQMPLYKRYYVSSIPGLGWTADYYITHNIHYIGAVILISIMHQLDVSYFVVVFFEVAWHIYLNNV